MKPRLELTWIGKDQRPKLEPRVLLPHETESFHAARRMSGNDAFDNRLIFGDNLLALKALEQEFAGQVKCVYIDPPYNTGADLVNYVDGLEHSSWLTMMRDRLAMIAAMLSAAGSCWVHLDDNEAHYCKVLMDEIFGRNNFVANVVWNKSYAVRSHAQFFSTAHEHILVFAKDRERLAMNKFVRSEKQEARYANPDSDPRGAWQSVTMTISLVGGARGRQFARTGESANIFDVTSPSGKTFRPPANRCWSRSPSGFEELNRDGRIYWGPTGSSAPRLKMFLGESEGAVMPTTLWADGDMFGLNQQGVRELRALGLPDFPTPKPERLLQRVMELATNPGDLVLDSFAGSGTTGAVAHKMGRRWIMIEQGEHCHTHIIPRLRKVIDGQDPGGVTEATGWRGGGGFRYFRVAPSLMEQDRFGNWVISGKFEPAMLAEAVCKLEGFRYEPSDSVWWMHGRSTESDFIYVTRQTLTRDDLARLSDEVGEKRTLLVMCGAFRCRDLSVFPNLTVNKIPQAVIDRCEWGKDDYSVAVAALLPAEPAPEAEPSPPDGAAKGESRKSKAKGAGSGSLFPPKAGA